MVDLCSTTTIAAAAISSLIDATTELIRAFAFSPFVAASVKIRLDISLKLVGGYGGGEGRGDGGGGRYGSGDAGGRIGGIRGVGGDGGITGDDGA